MEFFAQDGTSVLLAACGNLRAFIAQRLNECGELSAKANLAPITARVVAYPTGSAFESDWIVLERAREVDPGLYIKLNEQNRRALLVMNPAVGSWRVEDTLSLEKDPAEIVIGPIMTKKSAAALGETLDDVFELCRFPKELALTPCGTPCAYKQMGRCPGVCDGSEPISAYIGRFEQAVKASTIGVQCWKQQLKDQIKHASDAMEFEQAQVAKRQLEQVEKLAMDALGLARSMSELSCVCITPSVRTGWAMIWMLGSDGLVPIAAVNENQRGLEETICIQRSSIGLERIDLDRFALVVRHWMAKPARAKRRRVTVLDLNAQDWSGKLGQAINDACSAVELDSDDEEHTHIVN